MLNRRDGDFHNERIAAGAAVAFEDLIRLLRDFDNVAVIDAGDAHSDESGNRQADFCSVDVNTVAGDNAGVFESANAFDDGGRRQACPAGELGVAQPGVKSHVVWNI